MATAATIPRKRRSRLELSVERARTLYQRGLDIGSPEPPFLSESDRREREYVQHLAIGELLCAIEELTKRC